MFFFFFFKSRQTCPAQCILKGWMEQETRAMETGLCIFKVIYSLENRKRKLVIFCDAIFLEIQS